MRNLPAGVGSVASGVAYEAALALEFLLPTPIRVTNCPDGVSVGVQTYAYGLLQVNNLSLDPEIASEFVISNAADEVSSQDLAALNTGGVTGLQVILYEIYWDASGTQLGADELFVGLCQTVLYGEDTATITAIIAETSSSRMIGRFVERACGYVFKGADGRCGYGGAATQCDRRYATCATLGNASRYGGWPKMPTLGSIVTYNLVEAGATVSKLGNQRSTVVPAVVKVPSLASGFAPRPVRRVLTRAGNP